MLLGFVNKSYSIANPIKCFTLSPVQSICHRLQHSKHNLSQYFTFDHFPTHRNGIPPFQLVMRSHMLASFPQVT